VLAYTATCNVKIFGDERAGELSVAKNCSPKQDNGSVVDPRKVILDDTITLVNYSHTTLLQLMSGVFSTS